MSQAARCDFIAPNADRLCVINVAGPPVGLDIDAAGR